MSVEASASQPTVRVFSIDEPGIARRVHELQRASYAVEAELIGFDGIPPLHETIDEVTAAPLRWVGAFEQDRLIGAAGFTVEGEQCDIDRLFVDPERTRRGVGRSLVEHLLGYRVVTVSTGTRNDPACRLYRSLGFMPVGERAIAPGVTVTRFERIAQPA